MTFRSPVNYYLAGCVSTEASRHHRQEEVRAVRGHLHPLYASQCLFLVGREEGAA